jgi:hypothetical protein
LALIPAAAAICYPFLLNAFHAVVDTHSVTASPEAIVGATLILAVAFAVPFIGLAFACRPESNSGARRLAYASVVSPTLYVFLGVVQALVRSPIPDEVVWCVIWLGLTIWSRLARNLWPSLRRLSGAGESSTESRRRSSAFTCCFMSLITCSAWSDPTPMPL